MFMDNKKKEKKTSNIAFILSRTKKHKAKIVFACIFSVLASLCKLSPYILMQSILSSLIDKSPNNSLIFELVIWTCVLIVLNIIFTMLALGASHIAAFSVLYELRVKTIEHLGRLNLGFFRHHSSGQIKKALDESLPPLQGDERFLRQAIINIIVNSKHAMLKDGGVLSISTSKEENMVVVLISDSGDGIPHEILNKIFEPYFTTKDSGTGLGLTMTYKVIKEHGGDIHVYSDLGNGASFKISLPIVNDKSILLITDDRN